MKTIEQALRSLRWSINPRKKIERAGIENRTSPYQSRLSSCPIAQYVEKKTGQRVSITGEYVIGYNKDDYVVNIGLGPRLKNLVDDYDEELKDA